MNVVQMLEQINEHEETLTDKNRRALARLTMYRFPVHWYEFPVNSMGTEVQKERWLIYRILFDAWERGLWGNDFPNWKINELNEAIEQPFLTGRERRYVRVGIERGARWTARRPVLAEITYRNYCADVCERAGLDYRIDALAAGVPLEHVFPEYF